MFVDYETLLVQSDVRDLLAKASSGFQVSVEEAAELGQMPRMEIVEQRIHQIVLFEFLVFS